MTMARSDKNQARRHRTGRIGERIAALYLRLHGYPPVARNLRIGRGEVDLLLFKNGVIRIVEVRTTRGFHLACPTQAITPRKQRQLISLAKQLASQQPYCQFPICIDVIGVRIHSWRFPTVVWLKNAVDENSLYSCE